MHEARGTLHLLLTEAWDRSLSSATVEVYLNEYTYQVQDGRGVEIPYVGGGFDQPACVVRKATPDVVVVVPRRDDVATVEVPGVVYGANAVRLRIGGTDRAILAALHDELTTPNGTAYPNQDLLPLLFGTESARAERARHPGVRSGEPPLPGLRRLRSDPGTSPSWSSGALYFARLHHRVVGQGTTSRPWSRPTRAVSSRRSWAHCRTEPR